MFSLKRRGMSGYVGLIKLVRMLGRDTFLTHVGYIVATKSNKIPFVIGKLYGKITGVSTCANKGPGCPDVSNEIIGL